MIVRLFTSVAAHLLRNLTERPDEIHPSVREWGTIALTMKSEAEFDEWLRVAKGLRKCGFDVIPSWRLESASLTPWVDNAQWAENIRVSHRMMDAINSDVFAPDCEAYKADAHRSPSDIRREDEAVVANHCQRYADRLGANRVYVGPSSASCLLTRAFAEAGVDTIGVIQGNVQQLGAAELFGADRGALTAWYHERALALHQQIPGARAMPQLYASALRAHATVLPVTLKAAWVYVGSTPKEARQFTRATETEIGTRAWFDYATENALNVGCRWYGPGARDNVFPRGKTYSVIVRGAQWCAADKENLRSWRVDELKGQPVAVVSNPQLGITSRTILGSSKYDLTLPGATEQAGHIYGEGITSIEAWDRALTPSETETVLRNPYPRLKP